VNGRACKQFGAGRIGDTSYMSSDTELIERSESKRISPTVVSQRSRTSPREHHLFNELSRTFDKVAYDDY